MTGPFSEAMTVTVVEGEVVVLGPDGVGLSITPAAAEESGRRLIAAAAEARASAADPQPDPIA